LTEKEKAKDLWDKLSAVLESTCNDFETLKPILKEIKETFGVDNPIGYKANCILLTGNDFDLIEVDNLRFMIHEFWRDLNG